MTEIIREEFERAIPEIASNGVFMKSVVKMGKNWHDMEIVERDN